MIDMTREGALKIVRENYPHFGTTEPWLDLEKALATLIPELRESEDERIRKAIIEHFKQSETEFPGLTFGGYYYADVLAYLEKQKEQKPVDWDDELEKCKKSPLYFYDKYVKIKLKPAEWSEEEKDKLNSIERLIVNANAHGNHLIGDKEAIDLQHFIRSIVKPTTNLAEWSEEDERTIDRVCVALRAYANGELPDILPSEILEYADKLQSLRPQPHWKPSEEQMEALESAVKLYKNTHFEINHEKIVSLCEQLKKMM